MTAPFDPYAILTALERQRVAYVVIGSFARVIHGVDEIAHELEITPSRQPPNLARLQRALHELGAIEVGAEPGAERGHVHDRARAAHRRLGAGRLTPRLHRPAPCRPHASRSAAGCARRSPQPPTSPECSAHSDATKTDQRSSHSAA